MKPIVRKQYSFEEKIYAKFIPENEKVKISRIRKKGYKLLCIVEVEAWRCALEKHGHVGYGRSPKEAFEHWKDRNSGSDLIAEECKKYAYL